MAPAVVRSVTATVPRSGGGRGARGNPTGRAAGSSGVAVYPQGPVVVGGGAEPAAGAAGTRSVAMAATAASAGPCRFMSWTTVSSGDRQRGHPPDLVLMDVDVRGQASP